VTASNQPLPPAGAEIRPSETLEVYPDLARVTLNAIPRPAGILNLNGVLTDCNRAAVDAGYAVGSTPDLTPEAVARAASGETQEADGFRLTPVKDHLGRVMILLFEASETRERYRESLKCWHTPAAATSS